MKNLLLVAFIVFSVVQLKAQKFEGTVKYEVTISYTDPKKQAMLEESRKKDAERQKLSKEPLEKPILPNDTVTRKQPAQAKSKARQGYSPKFPASLIV